MSFWYAHRADGSLAAIVAEVNNTFGERHCYLLPEPQYGQTMVAQPLGSAVELQSGRIRTDAEGQTSHPKVWAGGDCRVGGRDLTVEAVEHGKVAARAIHAALAAASKTA